MFKKTMKFDNLDGEEVTQTFYFNYNKKEIAELLEFGRILRFDPRPGVEYLPLEEQMKRLSTPVEESGLSQRQNNEQAYQIFENLLLDAYGIKGEDNVSFNKTSELRHYWSTHVAFPEMVFEFLENPQLGAEFIERCLPARMVAKAKEEMAAEQRRSPSEVSLADMVEEAARRQEDPATRIEPGMQGAIDAGVATPEVAKLAEDVASGTKSVAPEDLTPEDIMGMDDVAFSKLDPQRLSREAMMAAFRRKSQG